MPIAGFVPKPVGTGESVRGSLGLGNWEILETLKQQRTSSRFSESKTRAFLRMLK